MEERVTQVRTTLGTSAEPRYYPIAQYGVIGDCRTAALIAPNGSIDWLCLPHFDSPAVFCKLLDADKGGYFRISPAGACESSMEYLPGTNILQTLFEAPTGRVRLVDVPPVRMRQRKTHVAEHLASLLPNATHGIRAGLEREVGNDVAAAHRVDRIVTCLSGEVTMDVTLKVSFDYARQTANIALHPLADGAAGAILTAGGRYLAFIARYLPSDSLNAQQAAPIQLQQEGDTVRAHIPLAAGQRLGVALNYARDEAEARGLLAQLLHQNFDADLDETMGFWRDWSALNKYDGPYQSAILRSALALKLCTFEPTGAIVAAPTTSLPEWIGGVRNWDYRYTWLRDSAFTLDALGELGYYGEARDYFHFINDLQIRDAANMRIMYSVRGETDGVLTEHELTHLEGYGGSRPVRIGNGAADQRQLDVYGELADAALRYVRMSGYTNSPHNHTGSPLQLKHIQSHLRERAQERIQHESQRDLRDLSYQIAEYVSHHWQEVDQGIWEVRGKPRPFVYSRAMCWVALDRACKLAAHHGHERQAGDWRNARERIHQDVLAHGYSQELQSFTQSYGDQTLDASNLRLSLTDFLPANDPHMLGTMSATERGLTGDRGLIYRYRPADEAKKGHGPEMAGAADDGLPGKEGAFLACTFWYVSNLALQGRLSEARDRFEQMLSYASPLGLFAEEIDPATGAQLGNYPQAFTHIGLINAATYLQHAQEGTTKVDGVPHGTEV
ncbi:MAG TPA: glycoside hydrolase family 15 protein [Ktedonobacterales bacterium]|nr:glycoside hydrolase family 15 protein [Ktedonobacterales bacterium]